MATKSKTTQTTERKAPPSRKIDDKAQYERFRQFASEHEADDDPAEFDRKVRKIVSSRNAS